MNYRFDLVVNYDDINNNNKNATHEIISKCSFNDILRLVDCFKHEHMNIHPNYVFDASVSMLDIHQRIVGSGYYDNNKYDLCYNSIGVSMYACYYINTIANEKVVKMSKASLINSNEHFNNMKLLSF